MSPGVPIMKSKDLINWKLVGYAYDTLADMDELNLANGKSTYGRGSWASSLRYHNGTYYVTTFAQTTGKNLYLFNCRYGKRGPGKGFPLSQACMIIRCFSTMTEKFICSTAPGGSA